MLYRYTGKTEEQENCSGEIEAESAGEAMRLLREEGIAVARVRNQISRDEVAKLRTEAARLAVEAADAETRWRTAYEEWIDAASDADLEAECRRQPPIDTLNQPAYVSERLTAALVRLLDAARRK